MNEGAWRSRHRRTIVFLLLMIGVLVLAPIAAAAPPEPDDPATPYRAEGLESPAERSEVARSGVDVLGGGRAHLEFRASDAQAARLRARGLELLPLPEVLCSCAQHAREHLTVEMCLHIVQRLAADAKLVDDHEVWVMPMIEMYPASQAEGGFYPPDSVIERETKRNDDAVDLLLRRAAGL